MRGANLHVSRGGRVQVINRWDLNGDGFNDVLISNDHDVYETVDAFVYWGFRPGVRLAVAGPLARGRWRRWPSD